MQILVAISLETFKMNITQIDCDNLSTQFSAFLLLLAVVTFILLDMILSLRQVRLILFSVESQTHKPQEKRWIGRATIYKFGAKLKRKFGIPTTEDESITPGQWCEGDDTCTNHPTWVSEFGSLFCTDCTAKLIDNGHVVKDPDESQAPPYIVRLVQHTYNLEDESSSGSDTES